MSRICHRKLIKRPGGAIEKKPKNLVCSPLQVGNIIEILYQCSWNKRGKLEHEKIVFGGHLSKHNATFLHMYNFVYRMQKVKFFFFINCFQLVSE